MSDNEIKSKIRTIPHFPKQGIMFRDVTTLFKDAAGLHRAVDLLVERFVNEPVDLVVGLEARGFILGGAVAHQLGKGFVPARKAGKLPSKTVRHEYQLEYGTDCLEMHVDAVSRGQRVLIVDDLLATGGTALGACALVEKLGGVVEHLAFVVDLPDLKGNKKLTDKGYKVFTLCEFEGD